MRFFKSVPGPTRVTWGPPNCQNRASKGQPVQGPWGGQRAFRTAARSTRPHATPSDERVAFMLWRAAACCNWDSGRCCLLRLGLALLRILDRRRTSELLSKTHSSSSSFWEGLSLSARQRSAPPKKRGPGPRGLRAHTVSTHPQLVQPPHPSALVAGVPVGATGATHVAAVPGTPAVCVKALSTRPTSVRPAAGLRRCVRRTSRLGLSSHPAPRQGVLQPTKEDLCLRPPDRGSPALPQVEHLSVLRLLPRGYRSDIDPPSRLRHIPL
jgi:hypothetical protein